MCFRIAKASLPLRQRGPLLRIQALAPFVRPAHQKDRMGAFIERIAISNSPTLALPRFAGEGT